MIKISDTQIYGLNKSIDYSGLPMDEEPDMNYDRAIKLGSLSNGHDNFTKGVTVQFLLTAPHYFIIQLQRYKFIDIVSSTSKMHQIKNKEFFLNNLPKNIPENLKNELLNIYDEWYLNPTDENFMILLNSVPLGFTLKEFLTTNYMSLKNIYYQRRNHKLKEWAYFCQWIKSLPLLSDILK